MENCGVDLASWWPRVWPVLRAGLPPQAVLTVSFPAGAPTFNMGRMDLALTLLSVLTWAFGEAGAGPSSKGLISVKGVEDGEGGGGMLLVLTSRSDQPAASLLASSLSSIPAARLIKLPPLARDAPELRKPEARLRMRRVLYPACRL